MLKRRVVAAAILGTMLLAGCGSKGFTGEKVGEVVDSKGENTTMATVKFEDGKPVSVDIDVKQADGTMKYEASEAGTYDMNNAPGKKWHEQVDLLETFLVDNEFDTTKVTLTNDKGNTDAVTGVSIKVGDYLKAVDAALEQAK